MKFWKFEYEGAEQLASCRAERRLPPVTQQHPMLQCTDAHPRDSMRIGDGVILATLDGDRGRIFGVGLVRQPPGDAVVGGEVDWAEATRSVYPDERGGLIHWRTKTAFGISAEPARRYGLKKFVEFYVG